MGKQNASARMLNRWIKEAPFVFQGTVKAIGASNLQGVEPDENMITMIVDEVIMAPRELGDLRGKVVTVYVQSINGLKKGDRITLFARSWHYGKNIGVIEVARTSLNVERIRKAAIYERISELDEKLKDRIHSSRLIISGKVISTYRSDETPDLLSDKKHPLGTKEDDVEWWKAEIWVKSVEKGKPPPDLAIFFPTGGDKKWEQFPKFYTGQDGVWLLIRVSDLEREGVAADRSKARDRDTKDENDGKQLIAADPLDFHSLSSLPRIQALLWDIEGGRR